MHCLCNGIRHRDQFSPTVRSFCMSMHFHSPRAYVFLREKFNKNLPHSETIRAWYRKSNIDAQPGIGSNSLRILNDKATEMSEKGKKLVCALIFDEMKVRRSVQWCHKLKRFVGYNTRINREEDEEGMEKELISEAIVFMLSGINTYFQLPIAFFL